MMYAPFGLSGREFDDAFPKFRSAKRRDVPVVRFAVKEAPAKSGVVRRRGTRPQATGDGR